ncbi:MAG: phage head closure protein [Clostridia bacterium]|nr:phage head closure protein [Clostridia bacterium]
MNAGELRHRVKIQQKSVTRDSFGAESVTWSDVATVWAVVEPLRGREFFGAQQVNAEVTTRIRIRYRSGVVPTMRALYGSRVYDIQSVINLDERNRELQLMCKEVV